MLTATSKTETGLTCNNPYTRYVWAYSNCGVSTATTLTQSTASNPPENPVSGTHIASPTQIIWNWNTVSGATGYKWSTDNNYSTAADIGNVITYTETGLDCDAPYSRYVWAYGSCGYSSATTLSQSTPDESPAAPGAGTHTASSTQIIWNWEVSVGATGYKWNTENNYGTATDVGNNLSRTETGLVCNSSFTRYVWAYNNCGESTSSTTLTQSTLNNPPAAPVAGTHFPALTQIVWNWNSVSDATGYRWSATNDFISATDIGASTSVTESNLVCGTNYTRYAWAYNDCGNSTPVILDKSTTACWSCGNTLPVNHVAGSVAPVDKTVTYGTVTNIPGETSKCWITSNLGADHQATAVNDATEAFGRLVLAV